MPAASPALRAQLAALRGVPEKDLPPALLDVRVQRIGELAVLRPSDWEQLRHEEGGAARPVPYWALPWPSGRVLASRLTEQPPAPGTTAIELGCGLALPSIAAAKAGAAVLATDGASDAVVFAAHSLALNQVEAEVALADWAHDADELVSRGPYDLVLAADILYLQANVEAAVRLLPRLVKPSGAIVLADPRRAGARDFLASARATFELATTERGEVALHHLTPTVARRGHGRHHAG